ncbi:Hypothetical_protein [Hexamita inflata]|uniref:Hypothetical_protein n=1 Tax=Hexamita inflata TaxID=28002 RepID=A0ABP1HYR3_9EUKA
MKKTTLFIYLPVSLFLLTAQSLLFLTVINKHMNDSSIAQFITMLQQNQEVYDTLIFIGYAVNLTLLLSVASFLICGIASLILKFMYEHLFIYFLVACVIIMQWVENKPQWYLTYFSIVNEHFVTVAQLVMDKSQFLINFIQSIFQKHGK